MQATDYTLQAGDTWFYEPPAGDAEHPGPTTLRPLDELVFTYHSTVGHNTVLELDFAIDRDGLVAPSHAALYKRLGDFIRTCYDASPLAVGTTTMTSATSAAGDNLRAPKPDGVSGGLAGEVGVASVTLQLGSDDAPKTFDRVVLEEDQTAGQRVRG